MKKSSQFVLNFAIGCILILIVTTTLSRGVGIRWDRSYFHWLFWGMTLINTALSYWLCQKWRFKEISLPILIISNTLLFLILAEGALNLLVRIYPTPFWHEVNSAARVKANLMTPGETYWKQKINSLGFYDNEWKQQKDKILVLSDSFGGPSVPHTYHFTTLLEKAFSNKLQVMNAGVNAAGMREYWTVANELDRTFKPKLIVLALFVGNDIDGPGMEEQLTYDFFNWWIFKIPHRVFKFGFKTSSHIKQLGRPGVLSHGDYFQYSNKGTYTKDHFLEMESERFQVCNTKDQVLEKEYSWVFSQLTLFKEKWGEKFVVMIIPDEFQVNKKLNSEILKNLKNPENYDSELPQKKLASFCQENKIACLDLLPSLKNSPFPKNLYLLRDSHWNVKAHELAAKELWNYLQPRL